MDEKEVFDLIDNLSEEELIESFEKFNVEHAIEDNINNEAKERIRKMLHKKMQENIEETKIKESKKSYVKHNVLKNKYLKVIIGSVAAMIIFVVLVNISPKFAYALENILGIDKLVKLVKFSGSYDRGFNKVIDEGRYQEINKTAKDKGAKFTVKTIAGDGLKLWIDYDFKGKDLIQGEIRFTDKNGKKILPWMVRTDRDGLINVNRDLNYNEFNIEMDVYKDSEEYHMDLSSYTEDELEKLKVEFEKSKVTTLVIPIRLNDSIFGQSSYMECIVNKNINTEIGDFILEKLEISPSRTNVYLKLNNEDYSSVNFENFRMIDGDGLTYFEADDRIYSMNSSNNNFVIQLSGGPKSIENLKLKCDKISYINNNHKYITVDLNKGIVEENIYGITLDKIEDNTVVLKRDSGTLKLTEEDITLNTDGYKFGYDIESCNFNYYKGIYSFKFKNFKDDIIKFEVTRFAVNKVKGFEVDIK